MKKKTSSKSPKVGCLKNGVSTDFTPSIHDFSGEEVTAVREELLLWYDDNKRDLPWRNLTKPIVTPDPNQRAYADWVSEIMLQQTQVATVIDYYNKWMKKWPTLQDLARASLEEVNTMWAGLGYYSRGKRLLEGAQKVVDELGGEMPRTAGELMKTLPEVGRYTAGAIASIAFNKRTGVVDGNVTRVLCRMRRIGADSTSQHVVETLWDHANKLVDPERPGDFNQAIMELGATVCTPKAPSCSYCPVKQHCKAYAQAEQEKRMSAAKWRTSKEANVDEENNIPDIECAADGCKLCIPCIDQWDTSCGVMNYSRKPKKKPPREERTSVCLMCLNHRDEKKKKYLLLKRPEEGLLSGLWEFPSVKIESENTDDPEIWLQTQYSICLPLDTHLDHIGEVVHNFSHITQTYVVDCLTLHEAVDTGRTTEPRDWKWMSRADIMESAISTAMKKVFKTYENSGERIPKTKKRKADSPAVSTDSKKQSSLHTFFRPKAAHC